MFMSCLDRLGVRAAGEGPDAHDCDGLPDEWQQSLAGTGDLGQQCRLLLRVWGGTGPL